ncbi:hypothetical protein GCM10009630_54150 [Kribbella jejuensis]
MVGDCGNQVIGARVVSGSGFSDVSRAQSNGTSQTIARITAPTVVAVPAKVQRGFTGPLRAGLVVGETDVDSSKAVMPTPPVRRTV